MSNTTEELTRCYYNIRQQERTADVYIYGDITAYPFPDNGDVSAYNLAKEIAELDVDTINVCINSNGGSVSEGLAIYSALCRHPAKIVTHCDGFACSAASVIFMAGDERLISRVGLLMIHEASVWAGGNAAELQKAAEDLAKISETAANAYKSRVNISDEELAQMLAAETWLTPDEAVAKGFATAVEKHDPAGGVEMSAQGRIAELVMCGLEKRADGSADSAGNALTGAVAEVKTVKNEMENLLTDLREVLAAARQPETPHKPAGGFFNFAK